MNEQNKKLSNRDKRLKKLVYELTLALEDPEGGLLFDDFDLRYRERAHFAEQASARWYYRNKVPFAVQVEHEREKANGKGAESGWLSDGGRGVNVMLDEAAYDLDGDEAAEDDPIKTSGIKSSYAQKKRIALQRVRRNLPHCLKTLKLIFKNGANRKESICSLMKSAN